MRLHLFNDQIGGLISIVIGGIVFAEAFRIRSLASSSYIGDHALPTLLGAVLILLGFVLFITGRRDRKKTLFPTTIIRNKMIGCIIYMFVHALLIPVIGYLIPTFMVSAALFHIIGSYRMVTSFFYAVLLTSVLYFVFVIGLTITFPRGVFF